jgi:hypothetical protein
MKSRHGAVVGYLEHFRGSIVPIGLPKNGCPANIFTDLFQIRAEQHPSLSDLHP